MASSSQGIAALAHIILPLRASHPTNFLPICSDTPTPLKKKKNLQSNNADMVSSRK